ncbi:MAG: hypothetical protein KJ852_16215 [Gammaproteobacteria bacterium]|nr:hypothetical protein [Gammaproteobacteria bacterium]MBU0786767.1 hypothetical protein [Gammaproteobacteria bacterium]MBU0814027.1 hypothetical protein [Gammaproteobacteria bacterium]MBU1788500.1 hypothetical protein [Gammaproteobacteria bacterium]
MRFRLLRRRLTISAPRMAVRSALPWPFRWAVLALVLGFSAAIALWAFEFGKDIAGLDKDAKETVIELRGELHALREDVERLTKERNAAQSVANTSDTLLTAEKAVQEQLMAQNKQLEAENRSLRDDLGFFEKLIPSVTSEGLSIRGLQAEVLSGGQVKWQVLVIQPQKNAQEFNGRLELTFNGMRNGKPWTMGLSGGPRTIKLKQYGRMEGIVDLPPDVVLQAVSAKVMDGNVTKAVQSIKL